MVLTVEPLAARHDRTSFSCGIPSLDTYLKTQATQDVRRSLAACYVLWEPPDPVIIGYYTVSATSLEPSTLPESLTRRLPRYPLFPAVLLGRLAVDSRFSGQGMGELLLLDAIRRAAHAEIAAMALLVDALDQRAASFYTRYGFQPFASFPLRLYLPFSQARNLL